MGVEQVNAAVKKALTPLIVLSCGLMALSGAFLAYQGALQVMWLPVIAFMLSPVLGPLLMVPAGFLAGMMSLLANQKPRAALVFQWLSLFYLWWMFAFTASFMLELALPFAEAPLFAKGAGFVWAWSASMAPWLVFVSRDRANVMMAMFVYFMGVGGLLALGRAALVADPMSSGGFFWQLFTVMCVLGLLQTWFEQRHLSRPKNESS